MDALIENPLGPAYANPSKRYITTYFYGNMGKESLETIHTDFEQAPKSANFVFEQSLQWFNQREIHVLWQAANIMVRLYGSRMLLVTAGGRARFYYVGIPVFRESAICGEIYIYIYTRADVRKVLAL